MPAIVRRSHMATIPARTVLAAADDLNGDPTNSATYLNLSGALRALILQVDNGTAGTAGIDVVEISHDGGKSWIADPTLLALGSDDATGTVATALNAAGVEPATRIAEFKSGPHEGPTLLRVVRDVAVNTGSAAWATGAPQVIGIRVG